MKRLICISLGLMLCACAMEPAIMESTEPVSPVSDIDTLEIVANQAYQASDWTKSEVYYTKLVDADPGLALYWYRLGNIYANTDRSEAAIIAYQQAISLNPEDSRTWFNLGMAHLKLATHSFSAVQAYGEPDTPITLEGIKLMEGILELLEQEQ